MTQKDKKTTTRTTQKQASKRNQSKKTNRKSFYDESRPMHRAMPYILILLGLAFGICLATNRLMTSGGWLGKFLAEGIGGLLSLGVYMMPLLFVLHGIYWRRDVKRRRVLARVLCSLLFLLAMAALLQAVTLPLENTVFSPAEFMRQGRGMKGGGLLGGIFAYGLYRLVGKVCFFILICILLGLYVCTYIDFASIKENRIAKRESMPKKQRLSLGARIRLLREAKAARDGYYSSDEGDTFESMRRQMERNSRINGHDTMQSGAAARGVSLSSARDTVVASKRDKPERQRFLFNDDTGESTVIVDEPIEEVPAVEEPVAPPEVTPTPIVVKMPSPPPRMEEAAPMRKDIKKSQPASNLHYQYPPLDLLASGEGDVMDDETKAEIERNSATLIDTLASFHVGTHIVGISRGPRITRYEILPNDGVSISSISSHAKDISLRLAAGNIRIQAPIPDIAAVGVEVPNRKPAIVRLKDMLVSDTFRTAKSKTTFCLGSDVTGSPVFGDISKMHHLLIAGATGMGKSVCMNAILVSLLYKARPDEVKLILIDPKKVEMNVYNNVPHLLVPVVFEPQAAAGALLWAVGEMERRFELIEAVGVRDIGGYNDAVKACPEKGEPLPKIIIVIDELNDLMMQARDSVEASICRIAQKARAAGMHLIIGTQRPSVNVITGVIKANIPSRIAFHVSSNVDSRTILDMGGAEKLLANGDMLVTMPGFPEPLRVQGSFVHEKEVDAVARFLQANAAAGGSVYDESVMEGMRHETEKYQQSTMKRGSMASDDDDFAAEDIWNDIKYCQIVELAIREGKISTSLIQRELSLGYGRAARYIDIMCKMGIVSEPNGPKPRDTLIDYAQYEEMRARSS